MASLKTCDVTVKRFWGITALIWTVIALFHYLQFYLQHVNNDDTFLWLATLAEFTVNYSSWVPIAVFIVWLGRRFRFTNNARAKPLVIHLVACIIIATAHICIVAAMLQVTKGPASGHTAFREYFIFCFLWLFHFEFLMYWVVLGLSYGFEYYSDQLSHRLKQNRYLERLAIKNNGRTVLLNTAKLDWLEAADNYVNIHVGDESYLLRERMHVLENKLDPHLFQRIHRSAIVNMSRIKELQHGNSGWILTLRDGQRLQVSRRRKGQLEKYLKRISQTADSELSHQP